MTASTDDYPLHRDRSRASSRAILTARRPGIERMIDDLPAGVEDREDLRRWALALTAAASAWEIDKCKRNSLARGGR